MLKPNYQFSQQLLSSITQIERFYGQLEGLKIPQKLELNLGRDNLVQSAYVSNSIEGNPLSLREVTNLLLDDRVPINRDEKEVRNYFDILQDLSQYVKEEFSLALITKIHRQLMMGVKDKIAGQVRNRKVVVGKYSGQSEQATSLEIKHEPPYHQQDKIAKAIEELCVWLNQPSDLPTVIKAGIFHHHFVYIHPFVDGNGRVCRLLTALVFLKNNYLINKYFVLDDYYDIDRMMYSDKLNTADKGDKTEWLEYFADGVKYSLQGSLARVKEAILTLKIDERPTTKEKQVMNIIQQQREITSTQLAQELKVSRQQAHNLLSSLVNKGLLAKKGRTKNSYYFIK